MTKINHVLLAVSLTACALTTAVAQDVPLGPTTTPKYIQVTVEYTKPGKGGMAHDKTEGAFVQAMTRAKFPIHYFAFNSMSGKPRTIYISGFDSYDELGKAEKVFDNPGVASTLEPLNVADGELLEDSKQIIFGFDKEISLRPGPDLSHMRFLEVDIIHVKEGHIKEFRELAKMWVDLFGKAGSAMHWDAFQTQYGEEAGYFVALTDDKSMAALDDETADGDKFAAALTDEQKKKMSELRAAAIDEDRTELYYLNPAQSYPPDSFIKADPGFWKPKAATAKSAAKPAADDKKAKP